MREEVGEWSACFCHHEVTVDETEEGHWLLQRWNPRITLTVAEYIVRPSGVVALRESVTINAIGSPLFVRLVVFNEANEVLLHFLADVAVVSMLELVCVPGIELAAGKGRMGEPASWMLPLHEGVNFVAHDEPVVALGSVLGDLIPRIISWHLLN